MEGKAIIVSAPSGAGKTTIVKHLLNCGLPLAFSVSACSRPCRPGEIDGKDYYFLGLDLFKKKIEENAFIEWEEVYTGMYYGTLKSEIERIWKLNKHVIFDVDVKGGVNLKKIFGETSLSIFLSPPTFKTLRDRLIGRNTETSATLEKRLARAEIEMGFQSKFDIVIVNDDLGAALAEAEEKVRKFISLPE